MAVAERHGLPVAVSVESATPREVRLTTNTLLQMGVPDAPQNLIGDNAYDCDKLDGELRQYGIELIAPHRINRQIRPRACVGIADVGKLKDCLPGYRISVGLLSVTNDTLRTFSGCSISRAA